jgi:hypothetical protein
MPRSITPVFKDLKSGKYRVISFFAKKARGQMARYIIDKEINEVAPLKKYRVAGYRYNAKESGPRELCLYARRSARLLSAQTAVAFEAQHQVVDHHRCRHVRPVHGHKTPRARHPRFPDHREVAGYRRHLA